MNSDNRTNVYPVILSGGSGLRLWPLSTLGKPKQFLKLIGPRSSFQETLLRLDGIPDLELPLIVTGAAHQDIIEEQLDEIALKAELLMEPEPRDSGPAIAAAAALIALRDRNAIMVVLAADHVIEDLKAFQSAVQSGVAVARAGFLTTFGMTPSRPETGFGYIAPGETIADAPDGQMIGEFKEKPTEEMARQYIDQGYFWNSGSFVFPVDTLISELEAFQPAMIEATRRSVTLGKREGNRAWLDQNAFKDAPRISIDHGLMELTAKAAMVPADMGWTDIGSWEAIWRLSDKDDLNNASAGSNRLLDAGGNLVLSDKVNVVTIGVQDLIIVATEEGVLVCPRSRSQDVKALLQGETGRTPEPDAGE